MVDINRSWWSAGTTGTNGTSGARGCSDYPLPDYLAPSSQLAELGRVVRHVGWESE